MLSKHWAQQIVLKFKIFHISIFSFPSLCLNKNFGYHHPFDDIESKWTYKLCTKSIRRSRRLRWQMASKNIKSSDKVLKKSENIPKNPENIGLFCNFSDHICEVCIWGFCWPFLGIFVGFSAFLGIFLVLSRTISVLFQTIL